MGIETRVLLAFVPGFSCLSAGAPIPGEDFYRALLKIWLGERPVQSDLKRALLGEKS